MHDATYYEVVIDEHDPMKTIRYDLGDVGREEAERQADHYRCEGHLGSWVSLYAVTRIQLECSKVETQRKRSKE